MRDGSDYSKCRIFLLCECVVSLLCNTTLCTAQQSKAMESSKAKSIARSLFHAYSDRKHSPKLFLMPSIMHAAKPVIVDNTATG